MGHSPRDPLHCSGLMVQTLISDKKQILERSAEHFDIVLNRPATSSDEAISHLPQMATNQELDIPPSSEEVSKPIKQMASGKAPSPDGIPFEYYKAGGAAIIDQLMRLY